MSDEFRRSRWLTRWFYTRHFFAQLGPIALVIFVFVGLVATAVATWTAIGVLAYHALGWLFGL